MHLLASGQKRLFPSPQALLIMRLTALLLTAAVLQVSARGSAQITLEEKNAPLAQVLQSVKQQSGYDLFYDEDLVKQKGKPVDIDVRNVTVEKALDLIFRGQALTYTLAGRIISVKERETPVPLPAVVPPPNDIHGRVTDSLGNPLAGASVTVKGSKRGTATNEKGEFDLKGIGDAETLVISFSGFETRQITVHGKDGWQIVLSRSNSQLDQVQVIAYGTTTERLSTGDVTTVTSKEIEEQPVNNPLLALEGRVPGLFITQANGLPGSGVTVRIQGQNSIANGNDPLYVVDGMPFSSQMLPTTSGGPLGGSGGGYFEQTGGGNPLSYINPADIESISILKDADATAIYGSRAANGAILITTKKGKAGPTKLDMNFQQGWGEVTRKLDILNTPQYLQMRNEAIANDGLTANPTSDFDLTFWDTTRNTDWQKALIGNLAHYTTAMASVSGGTANTQYLVSSTYHRETDVFPGDFADQKGSLHFTINNASINQKFHLQFSGNYLVDDNQLPQNDLTGNAIAIAPDAPALYNADGTLNYAPTTSGTSTFYNPLKYTYNTYQNKTTNLISNLLLSYQLFSGLAIKGNFGYTSLQTNEFSGNPLIAQLPELRQYSVRTATYSNSTINSWTVEPQLDYKKTIEKGKLEALIGTTILQNNSNGQSLQGSGYNSDAVLADVFSAATVAVNSSTNSVYKYNALFGRINYNWADKYIIDLTARRDGSSRFGALNQFHNFASVGGAWLFSQEGLIKNNAPFISFGKLRASYGTTGNDQIGNYQYLSLYSPIPTAVPYQNTTSLTPNGLANPYLQWEQTKKMQFGADLGFSHDKILLTADYVVNRSSNELLSYALPIITGFNSIIQNFPATVKNTAWELSLVTVNIKSKTFAWSSNINFTIPQNKLIDFPNLATSTYSQSLVIGRPISVIHAYHFLGADPSTGVYKFASKTDPFNPQYGVDNTVLINTLPKFYGGFQNSFSYNGFQLDFLFQFVKQKGSNDLFNTNPVPGQFNSGFGNQPATVLKRWQKPGDITNIQRYNSDGSLYSAESYASGSDAAYSDASYIRLKNLSLSYNLPAKSIKKTGLQNFVIFIRGQNLLTITKFKGMDPENQSVSALPPLRVLTAGIQVGL